MESPRKPTSQSIKVLFLLFSKDLIKNSIGEFHQVQVAGSSVHKDVKIISNCQPSPLSLDPRSFDNSVF